MILRKIVLVHALLLSLSAIAVEDVIEFAPEKNYLAKVGLLENEITYAITTPAGVVSSVIAHQVERPSHVVVDDFNFDGKKDFSVWYFDEGMGSHSTHRVFIYSTKKHDFVEKFSSCATEFINLVVDNYKKQLRSTFFVENTPKVCSTRIDKSD